MKKSFKKDFVICNTGDRLGVEMIHGGKRCFSITVESGNGIAFQQSTNVWVKPGKAFAMESKPYRSSGPDVFQGFLVIPFSTPVIRTEMSVVEHPDTTQYKFSVVCIENGKPSTLMEEEFYDDGEVDIADVRRWFSECVEQSTRGMEKVAF